jgi:UDP-MurNAc hydroxylase
MIRFINHASFEVRHEGVSLVCDPWLSGSAFANGWRLIAESPSDDLTDFDYIWFSHEHPDHFSVPFLKSIPAEKRAGITILYQQTNDRRVVSFCEKLGYRTLELADAVPVPLRGGIRITCGQIPFYDSWARIEAGDRIILNTNDCILESPERLSAIRRHVESCDILFTQFSYANWQGRQDAPEARRELAVEKLRRIKIQCEAFSPQFVVPFASFVYFSHSENAYMNSDINTPEAAVRFIERECSASPVLLVPGERWDGRTARSNEESILYWNRRYREAIGAAGDPAGPSVDLETLTSKASAMMKRVGERNNFFLVRALQRIGLIVPVDFELTDLGVTVSFDWLNGLRTSDRDDEDRVRLHSESLAFVFDNDFGVDTVNVNARFDTSMAGKKRMVRLFSVLALNNTGRHLRLRDVRKYLSAGFLRQGLRTVGIVKG